MPQGVLRGRALTYGDNIDTDVIIPARYCTAFLAEELAPHCLEDLDPDFLRKRRPGDILVAGVNFGCGSSRENAPIAIKGAGIAAVIAKSFSRIFFRNAINIGLPILEAPEAVQATAWGEELAIDLARGTIQNITRGKEFASTPFPPIMQEIIDAGGMVEFVRRRLAARR